MATYDHVLEVHCFVFHFTSAIFLFLPVHPQELKNEILIQSAPVTTAYYLGRMGDSDPSEFITKETNQIPFKASTIDPASWTAKLPFKNWPKMPKGWRNWYRRVSEKKGVVWETSNLSQCLNLSLSQMERNEPLLISACHFWSNSINAFIFDHGPMTISLADIHMMISLQITGALSPFDLLNTGSKKLPKILVYSGWVSYIKKNQGNGPNVEEKRICRFYAYVARKICILWIILWPSLQS